MSWLVAQKEACYNFPSAEIRGMHHLYLAKRKFCQITLLHPFTAVLSPLGHKTSEPSLDDRILAYHECSSYTKPLPFLSVCANLLGSKSTDAALLSHFLSTPQSLSSLTMCGWLRSILSLGLGSYKSKSKVIAQLHSGEGSLPGVDFSSELVLLPLLIRALIPFMWTSSLLSNCLP